jgi:hypothetical protein
MIVPNRFKVPDVLKGKNEQRFNSIHFYKEKKSQISIV